MQEKKAEDFTSISPCFAQATLKFTDNHQFAYLCSFLIENSKSLITDSYNDFLFNNFNPYSDIVTLLNAIYEQSKYNDIINYNTGLSNSIITTLYTNISRIFDLCDGREAVINAVKWSNNQPGGTMAMTDKFVNLLLEQNEFKEKRRYTFIHALNTNFDNKPSIIYKNTGNPSSTISIKHRPGWHGLEIPGNIIILNDDYLIHRDPSNQVENPGIVGLEFNNPSLNSIFFLSLLESYLNDQDIEKDFIEMYRSPNPDTSTAFLFHINNDKDVTILNFCPRTYSIEKILSHTISMLLTLMPFVPYSILFNVESLECAIEVNSYGQSVNYIEKVHFYSKSDENLSFAYPLCEETLEFASHNIEEMKLLNSPVRFAITGEYLLYKDKKPNINRFPRPDSATKSTPVFDQNHPSHLILLVDKKYSDQPLIKPLSWFSPQKNEENLKNDITKHSSFQLLYIPETKEEELLLLNSLVKDKEKDTTCISMCCQPREFLSRPLFIYQSYDKAKSISICKNCQIVVFQSIPTLKTMIDPQTHKVNLIQLAKMYRQMLGISLNIECGSNCPLGQIIWALMNDIESFDDYVKSYFTIFIEYTIHSRTDYFTFCPNHPDVVFRVPKNESEKCCCSFCGLNYCVKCKKWHNVDVQCKVMGIEDDIKFCPRCLKPIQIYEGRGIVSCNCGVFFCAKCGDKSPVFNSMAEAYDHINDVHNNIDKK